MNYYKSWTQDVIICIETFGDDELTESSLHDLLKNPTYFAEGLQKGFIRISPVVGGSGFMIIIDKEEEKISESEMLEILKGENNV